VKIVPNGARLRFLASLMLLAAALLLHATPESSANHWSASQATPPSRPEIPASETISPDELEKGMAGQDKPIVVCVAPRFLYDGAHIPGALFHGPGSTSDGVKDLRHWAESTPRDRAIVLYCGCCPISRCPNVRPALGELREMGFKNVKVLWLPKDFHTDWIEKGYPIDKAP
jgi:thiosulfate/3-mercaptopyruvate sulfurtransferase